jgi:hypothetical protein
MARSLNETLTAAARAAVEANDWERDRQAWNLPRSHSDRYASRRAIATEHGGAFSQFVEEPDETSAAHAAESSASGEA